MKKWLSYIIIPLGCMWFSSCQNEMEAPDANKEQVAVSLSIAIPGDGGTAVRAFEDDGFDLETTLQRAMDEQDLFVLIFKDDSFYGQVKGLSLEDTGDSHTKQLSGKFLKPATETGQFRLVVFANLVQNKINGTDYDFASMQTYIDGFSGLSLSNVYQRMIYHYNGATPWNITNRRIPMSGITNPFSITGNFLEMNCNLHRAVAKLGFLVNGGEGIEGFEITGIEIQGAMTQGYCASSVSLDADGYFTAPSVPAAAETQTITYNENVTKKYIDEIYLPEQDTAEQELIVKLTYTANGGNIPKVGTIRFYADEQEKVLRNHSYIFDINISDVDASLYYEVTVWSNETVNIPNFE